MANDCALVAGFNGVTPFLVNAMALSSRHCVYLHSANGNIKLNSDLFAPLIFDHKNRFCVELSRMS